MSTGTQLGRFTILRQLGVGGMGTVFAAYDEQLDRKVALKILHNPDNEDQCQHEKTMREAKALARVRHPRVVSIYDVGTANGRMYLAMEFVDGVTLRDWLAERNRSWREILLMFIQAGEGLAAAHDAGVIHRDFKPDNVLVGTDGLPLVLDFGVARLGRPESTESERTTGSLPSDSRFTYQGVHSGTPGYMSPEQYGDEPVGSASDQFSFCAALYEALYGHLPFAGTTVQEHASSVRGPIRKPSATLDVPADVFRILSRGLSVHPGDRFPSMRDLLHALATEHGQTPSAAAASRRNLMAALLLAISVAFLLVQYLSGTRARLVRESINLSLIVVSVTVASGLINRRALRVNSFHRNMYTQLLIVFCQILTHRLSLLVFSSTTFRQILVTEMLIWMGTMVTLAAKPIRRLCFAPLIPLLGIVVGLVVESVPRGPALFLYLLCASMILWAWHAEARHVSGEKNRSPGALQVGS